ncbi:MAG: UDP-N-acetylmuramoyl-L-alanyl-D-glutamate--2,6-diaminopimelate ligase [Chloroflexi bacterium]|nr:UDP-N-acetylmuramoyl-L-alanyl-D-glutamate--2,6-diaminopimelate ligase [Chloroflexota bacterium]
MQLANLLRALPAYTSSNLLSPISNLPNLEITRVTDKSHQVIPGALFVAYPGVNVDGAQFIPDAIQRGAVAIVTQTLVTSDQSSVISHQSSVISHQSSVISLQSPVSIFVVPDGRAALAQLAAAWHNHPTRHLRVIGVTGTDGKTTTSTLIENILLAAGHTVGTITTVAAHIGGREVDTGFHTTTPDAPEIQNYLAQMVERGAEYAVIESTSHGFAQHRLDAVDFDIAVVTNITHEHLDLHGTWEKYRDAKAMLFHALMSSHRKPRTKKVAVLNADDNARGVFDFLREIPADERIIYRQSPVPSHQSSVISHQSSVISHQSSVISHQSSVIGDQLSVSSLQSPSELLISARDISHTADGLRFTLDTPFGKLPIESPLIGRHNVSNILAAAGAAMGRRIPFSAIVQGVKMTRGIVGRMERIENTRGLIVIVDFAHTPNALENALKTARELTQGEGRVISVFGCAGLRDVQKRAWMGEISGTLADFTVVTAEDPRTESLAQINAQIAQGLHKANRSLNTDYFIIAERGDAIDFSINKLAQPNDVVIICGKGHERSICFGTTESPWSDQGAARRALEKE